MEEERQLASGGTALHAANAPAFIIMGLELEGAQSVFLLLNFLFLLKPAQALGLSPGKGHYIANNGTSRGWVD